MPGVATVRLLDDLGQVKVRRGPRGTQYVRQLALSAGMTVKAFKALRGSDRAKIRWAFLMITAPSNVGREPDPVD